MAGNNNTSGILNDAYGALYSGGQRFFGWTLDAFNPSSFGVANRMYPVSPPELLGTGSGNSLVSGVNSGVTNLMGNVPPFSIQSAVPWIIGGLLLILVYHWWEYERGGSKK